MSDKVHINGLQALAIVGLDHWQKPVPHPISVDVDFHTDFSSAARRDNLKYSLNYAVISESISGYLRDHSQTNFHSLGGLACGIYRHLAPERAKCRSADVTVSAPKLDIRAPVSFSVDPENVASADSIHGIYHIHGLRALTLIGVFTFERLNKQYVLLDIDMHVTGGHLPIADISASVCDYLEQANFKTVEALVKKSAQWILQQAPLVDWVNVHVTKPNAIVYTDGVGVSCRATRDDFVNEPPVVIESGKADLKEGFDLPVESEEHVIERHVSENHARVSHVFIAFGSNSGNQLGNIQAALSLLDDHPNISVESTLSLYVSKPMYVKEQADFYNGVVRIKCSNMTPRDLLRVLKNIEYHELQRIKTEENGPRSIDLDIILFDNATITTPDLVIPHKSMLERTFVLQPLCELLSPDYLHPVTAEPVHNHLRKLLASSPDPSVQESSELVLVVPGFKGKFLTFSHSGQKPTLVMGVFNATPDSFSDGGRHFGLSRDEIITKAVQMKADGASIIDIGGVSTRPGSSEPTTEEELARVVPVVEAIRSCRELDDVFVSVDTYRAEIAEITLNSGADIINDISMGTLDDDLFKVVARHSCGYIMGHTRGTPQTMNRLTSYSGPEKLLVEYHLDQYAGMLNQPTEPVINGVCREISVQLNKAMEQGVRKWQIMVDPGIGFAKNLSQNLALIRNANRIKQYAQNDLDSGIYTSFHGLGLVLGASRKKFLGTISHTMDPAQRVLPTAATVVAGIEQNVDIVRVHDVAEMHQAVLVGDAIYKNLH